MQLLWALGERFDALVACGMDGPALRAPGVQFIDLAHSLSNAEQVALYYQGVVDHARLHGQSFVSGCMDKSSVQSYNMQLAPICLSNNSAFWTVPQDTLIYPSNRFFVFGEGERYIQNLSILL
jgi:hypothetical protein